jgi:hypothetical protein
MVREGLGHAGVQCAGVVRQVHMVFGSAVDLPALVVQQPLAQRPVRHALVLGLDRQVDVQSPRVGLLAVLVEHQLPCGLGDELRMQDGIGRRPVAQLLVLGGLVLLGRDEAVVEHALDDVLLAHRGALGVGDGVVGRRRLRQPGQHGRLGHGDVLQRLAEVRLARGRKTVGPLPEVDLVHVDLEDLLLGQQALDLQGEQDLVDLARERLFAGQVEVARHLHRDGGRALALRLVELRQSGADDAEVVHPAMLVEAGVLDGQHGVLHHLRDVADRREVAPLLAVFAEHDAVGRVHAHRQLGPVVQQAVDVGQVRIGDRQRDRDDDQQRDGAADRAADEPCGAAQRDAQPSRPGRGGIRFGQRIESCGQAAEVRDYRNAKPLDSGPA